MNTNPVFQCLSDKFECLNVSGIGFNVSGICPLQVCVLSICKYVFLFFCLNVCQFLYLWFSAYLFGWYNASVIILSFVIIVSLYIIIYHYVKFWFCNTNFIFINHHPSCFISFFQPSFGGEFETLSSSGMVYPYPFLLLLSVLSYA